MADAPQTDPQMIPTCGKLMRIRERRFTMRELLDVSSRMVVQEVYVRVQLLAEGFDLSRPMESWKDFDRCELVYQQKVPDGMVPYPTEEAEPHAPRQARHCPGQAPLELCGE